MQKLARNIGTISTLSFATGAFLAELAGALPAKSGAIVTTGSLIALAIGRGLVKAAEIMKGDD